MPCPQCRHENPPAQKFCGECGARLSLTCAGCGASSPPGQKFCGECGARLGEQGGAPPKQVSPESYTPKHWTGRRAEGVALMQDAARGLAERTVRWPGWAGRVGSLGEAYLLDGRMADATRIAQEGLAAARQRGARGVEGQVLRLLGDIAAHPDRLDVDTAEAHHRQALALAEALALRPLLARCHLTLGALYRRAGKREQAGEHVTTAGTMFAEMDMPFWLTHAEAELKELA